MENKPYIFLGFDIRKISFEKGQLDELTEIRISVGSFNFDKEDNTATLAIEIEIDYEQSKKNCILYSSGFTILNKDMKADISSKEKINEYVPLLLRTVLPFIRESLMSITKDAGNVIMLPTIDCQEIDLDKTLILTAK